MSTGTSGRGSRNQGGDRHEFFGGTGGSEVCRVIGNRPTRIPSSSWNFSGMPSANQSAAGSGVVSQDWTSSRSRAGESRNRFTIEGQRSICRPGILPRPPLTDPCSEISASEPRFGNGVTGTGNRSTEVPHTRTLRTGLKDRSHGPAPGALQGNSCYHSHA